MRVSSCGWYELSWLRVHLSGRLSSLSPCRRKGPVSQSQSHSFSQRFSVALKWVWLASEQRWMPISDPQVVSCQARFQFESQKTQQRTRAAGGVSGIVGSETIVSKMAMYSLFSFRDSKRHSFFDTKNRKIEK